MRIPLLDHGYVELIDLWGSDEKIIEAARMSTAKGFKGWGTPEEPGDEKLLQYLWDKKHHTPFEMAGMVIEVKAPIMVFREWHRHRTQSYNEMSARYIPLPDENYVPTKQRIIDGARASGNRQAAGMQPLREEAIEEWLRGLQSLYGAIEMVYQTGLLIGVPKELARLPIPVGRYSRMRASANLRNWLGFLTLRCAPDAQWEIRQFANVVASLVMENFPRTGQVSNVLRLE